jgi:hypothetical protein
VKYFKVHLTYNIAPHISVLYFRPSRFFPGKESTERIIDNLVYVTNTMLEKEQACTDGIGVIMNMTD